MGNVIALPQYVIGVDEVGTGALAGPITICAVAAPTNWEGFPGMNDSKQVQEARRLKIASWLLEPKHDRSMYAKVIGYPAIDIDVMGMAAAHRQAVTDAIKAAVSWVARIKKGLVTEIIVDGNLNFRSVHPKVRSEPKADGRYLVVMAASIIAKVTRDSHMPLLDPRGLYSFTQNKGYGTKDHLDALERHGPGPFHRYSTEPVKRFQRETTNGNSC